MCSLWNHLDVLVKAERYHFTNRQLLPALTSKPLLSIASVFRSLAILQPSSMRVWRSCPRRACSLALCSVLFAGGLVSPNSRNTAATLDCCSASAYCLQVLSKECFSTANATSNHRGAIRGLPLDLWCEFEDEALNRSSRKGFKASMQTINWLVCKDCSCVKFILTLPL